MFECEECGHDEYRLISYTIATDSDEEVREKCKMCKKCNERHEV